MVPDKDSINAVFTATSNGKFKALTWIINAFINQKESIKKGNRIQSNFPFLFYNRRINAAYTDY
jgi:hypothetical protein